MLGNQGRHANVDRRFESILDTAAALLYCARQGVLFPCVMGAAPAHVLLCLLLVVLPVGPGNAETHRSPCADSFFLIEGRAQPKIGCAKMLISAASKTHVKVIDHGGR